MIEKALRVLRFILTPPSLLLILLGPAPLHAQGIWIGPGVPFQTAMIQNMTNLPCSLMAYGKEFDDIAPGQTIYAGAEKKMGKRGIFSGVSLRGGFGWYAGSLNIQIPIVARCYSNDMPRKYIGEANTIFDVPGSGYSSANSWIIRPSDVQRIDNEPVDNSPFHSALTLKRAKMPFPGFLVNSLHAVQIVNNSEFVLLARTMIGGVQSTWVRPGEVYYVAIPGYRTVVVDIKATDPADHEKVVGVWANTFYGQSYGVTAQNIVLDSGSFQ